MHDSLCDFSWISVILENYKDVGFLLSSKFLCAALHFDSRKRSSDTRPLVVALKTPCLVRVCLLPVHACLSHLFGAFLYLIPKLSIPDYSRIL